MSRTGDIWAAHRKGEEIAEEEGISGHAVHQTFGHIMATMLPDGNSDEEIAFEKGYHGDELELCDDCEHVVGNCDCGDE